MLLSEMNPRRETDTDRTEETPAKPADFMDDSAGNVAPSTKRKAESLAGRTAPTKSRWTKHD